MDWNNDGNLDILSGCYWTEDQNGGHIQILKGKGEMDFEKSESVLNMAGKPLQNLETDGKDQNVTLAICTEQHAVDYDGDGDLDLVVGCFGNNFYLYENVSDDKDKFEIAETPRELDIKSTSYHSAPHLVDWDGDGDLDLLSGSGGGGAIISENTGTSNKPVWSAFKQLIEPSALQEQSGRDEIQMGPSTRIWATDFNKDGLLDLLVGDCTNIVTPKEGLTDEEFQAKRDAHQKAMEEMSKRQQELMPEYQKYAQNGEEMPEELQIKMEEMGREFGELYGKTSEFQESKQTGHVWVLIRKADQEISAANNSDLSRNH